MFQTTTEVDLPDLLALWCDGRVMKWVGFPNGLGYGPEEMTAWFARLQADPHRHHFTVRTPAIGFCGEVYYAVDPVLRRAGLDIKFAPQAQGQGLASDALTTLIGLVFDSEPGVEAVWTEPSAENRLARKLYARCGLMAQPRPEDMAPGESYWELRREAWTNR